MGVVFRLVRGAGGLASAGGNIQPDNDCHATVIWLWHKRGAAASLAGLVTLSVTNDYCDLATYNSYLPDISNAVNAGMTLIVHDRMVIGSGSMLPGGGGINGRTGACGAAER